ncbi:MAG TPA: cob(I)yrinic acid a,c-diamide adenosyltransferase [Acidimicrobiales bacterium]|nr:cob(I)yrinic acid a,c-diamide adenosyltransferase [Acidimicrobiales bacterium]
MSISTKRGDAGTTGLLYGGRVRKDSARIECNGAVDEAQAALGYARAVVLATGASGPGNLSSDALDGMLVSIERDLWVLMAEVATADSHRSKLVAGASLVTKEMVDVLTSRVTALEALQVVPNDFVVPGENLAGASLDVARTVVRRAERLAVAAELPTASAVVPYLNRLSDLCWLLARAVEGEHLTARVGPPKRTRHSPRLAASDSTPSSGQ